VAFYVKGYTVGRVHHRGEPCEARATYSKVLVILPGEIEKYMGIRKGKRLTQHLRWLRDVGELIGSPGRLQSKVQRPVGGGNFRAYVFDVSDGREPPDLGRGRVRLL
jgi:hypothetical protein